MEQREYARLQTQDGQAVSLQGIKLAGDLRGLLFEASIEQRFCNPTDKNVEVVYSFPLPWSAVLLNVDVLLGDKHLTGTIVEKKQAEADYEEAISEGNSAIMLEKNHDDSYNLNLGNLAAGELCTITLHYAQTLQFEQHGLRLLIPTVIAPRYGDAVQEGGLMPHQAPEHSLTVEYPFELEVRLHGDLVQSRVASPSHSVSVAHANNETGNVLTVSLACRASLDRDFILVVDQLAHDSVAIAARDAVEPESMAILASFCPRLHAKNPESAAVKILVDCSGSMAGDSIEAAKRALQAIVQQFGAGDRFSLSRFGSTVEHRSRGLWKATETTKRAAQRWVEELEADLGGTEMESALTSTFALAQTVSSDVLIVTDGEISAIDQTIESAKASGHRLFVVGIGSSPTETHLHRLAEATGGACDFVAPGEAVEPAVLRMFARLRSPRLVDLRLDWPEGITPTWVSPLQLSVFDGDTVNVFALLRQMPEGERGGELHLQGKRFDDEAFQKIGCVSFSGEVASADTLSRMVASARIKALENEDQAEVETQRLALAYQLLSDQTNFLLIHERQEGEKAADMPVLRKVDQMLPAGWGSMGSALAEKRVAYLNDVPSYGVLYQKAKKFNDMAAIVRARKPVAYLSDVSYDNPLLCQISVNHDKKGSMGLTPLEVSEWLCTTPKSEWPTSYDGLNEIGIHKRLLVWLIRLIIPHGVALFEESKVVTAFLYLMSRQATHNVLAKSAGIFKFTRRQLREIFSREPAADPASIDVSLLETIADALNGMRGDAWPEQVWSRRSAKDKTEK